MRKRLWALAGGPLGFLIWASLRLIEATARMTLPAETERPTIYVNWHRHLPLLMLHHGRRRRWFMMSASPHMAPIARFGELCGLRLVRGASRESGRAALGEMAAKLRAGDSVVLAVDGPAGPVFRVKPGCVDLALETGAPIVPLAYRGRPQFQTPGRWDRQLNVWPFSRVELLAGEPIEPLPGEPREALLSRVQRALEVLERAGRS